MKNQEKPDIVNMSIGGTTGNGGVVGTVKTDEKQPSGFHNFTLDAFAKVKDKMVATSKDAYTRGGLGRASRRYTDSQIEKILESGTLREKRELSQFFYDKGGYYKQFILHYATLLKYNGILIPSPNGGKTLSDATVQKRINLALDYVENMRLPVFCTNCAVSALINGCYYGLITENDKNVFAVIDLPVEYCSSRFKDVYGNDIIEFDLKYFTSINDEATLKAALAAYPSFISSAYRKWSKKRTGTSLVMIPGDQGICLPLYGNQPMFLDVLPALIQYESAVENELERQKEEIHKIIVQKIPHLNDGRLLFEPDEAQVMHEGTTNMVRSNKNTSVVTTYGDVDVVSSKSSADNISDPMSLLKQNIYTSAGISSEIFAATGGNTTETSLKYDTAVMMGFANKIGVVVTNLINSNCSNSAVSFKYTFLPITYQNETHYLDSAYKLSTAGYSLLIPAIAQGLSQKDLVNLKDLENDYLDLTSKLIPPQTAYTQSGESEDVGGRPKKDPSDKKDQTIKNEQSVEKSKEQQGGSD